MVNPADALAALDFGRVDSESEPDLAARFLRTSDFDRFLDPIYLVIIGAKGSGKSALFEMFAKNLPTARGLAGGALNGVLIVTATGFGDLSEISTADIQSFQGDTRFSYENLWKVYIALKLALGLGQQGYSSTGPLRDLLRAAREVTDYRVGPMLSSLTQLILGTAPSELTVNVMGNGVELRTGRATIDVIDLLEDIEDVLRRNGQTAWLLFDKIDEIYPSDPEQRRRALEALFPACMFITRRFPHVVPRVFIRNDLFTERLRFTNKDHLRDKRFDITWQPEALRTLLVKRALVAQPVSDYVSETVSITKATVEDVAPDVVRDAFYRVFDARAYPGRREAEILSWMVARASDASGNAYPREMINYGNIAKRNQLDRGGPGSEGLIAGRAVVDAYYEVSRSRYQDVLLGEFPQYEAHFRRFRGRHDAPYVRAELDEMFADLSPAGADAIEALNEAGVLAPVGNADLSNASEFTIPRLYRAGLNLQIIARP